MKRSEIICDVCGITCKSSADWSFSMQIDKTDEEGNYKRRYLFKDLCPRCAGNILRYIGERQYMCKDFIKYMARRK